VPGWILEVILAYSVSATPIFWNFLLSQFDFLLNYSEFAFWFDYNSRCQRRGNQDQGLSTSAYWGIRHPNVASQVAQFATLLKAEAHSRLNAPCLPSVCGNCHQIFEVAKPFDFKFATDFFELILEVKWIHLKLQSYFYLALIICSLASVPHQVA